MHAKFAYVFAAGCDLYKSKTNVAPYVPYSFTFPCWNIAIHTW